MYNLIVEHHEEPIVVPGGARLIDIGIAAEVNMIEECTEPV